VSEATPLPARQRRAFATASEAERARAMRRAQWHSRAVAVLRVGLPVVCFGLLGIYGLSMRQLGPASSETGDTFTFDGPQVTATTVGMSNPRYEGFNNDGSRYVVTAEKATSSFKSGAPIKLETINGKLFQLNDAVTVIDATRGTYAQKDGRLELKDGILIRSTNGMTARLMSATVLPKLGKVRSSEPVEIAMPSGTIVGRSLNLDQKTRDIKFDDGVEARLKPPDREQDSQSQSPSAAPSPDDAPANRASNGLGVVPLGRSDKPVLITAKSLHVADAQGLATFRQNVRALQDGAQLTAKSLQIVYERDADLSGEDGKSDPRSHAGVFAGGAYTSITATDDVVIVQNSDTIYANRFHYVEAEKTATLTGRVRIERRGENQDTIFAQKAVFHSDTGQAKLTGDVRIKSANDRKATAQSVAFDQTKGTALLKGQVEVTQSRNRLTGERLAIDQTAGSMVLTSPSGQTGGKAGRIAARFYSEPDGSRASKPVASTAQAPGGGPFAFQTNPDAPIDVAANRLDVDDQARTAVFKGDVRTQQGGMTIETQSMTAHYTGSAQLVPVAGSKNAHRTKGGQQKQTSLSRIEANGGVRITSENGQRAVGDDAVFDVASNTVSLTGNVILTQGRQKIRGTKLTIDVTTGVSRIVSAPAASAGAKRKRMRAVFFPKDLQDAQRAQKTSPDDGTEAPGWSATTRSGTN